jgi:hypothetical protein
MGLAFAMCPGGTARAQDDEGDQDLPPGHPGAGAHGGPGTMPGVFNPPEDTEQEDPTLPPGTIAVELHDGDDKPVPNETVTLGMIINSVAKGDSRRHLQLTTDSGGRAVFKQLETVSNIAYRVSTGYQGGAFAATPFQLGQVKSMRVVLHVYPVTRDVQKAIVVSEATLAAEVRDDRIQIEEILNFYNLGRTAWQPDDVLMKLPAGATAFSAQANMSDQGVDEVNDQAKLRGTFAPGRHSVQFRWQLPWSNDPDVEFDIGMPPHVAIARVMLPAAAGIKLTVAGFPAADVRHDQQGQGFLVTEKHLKPEDAKLSSLSVGIHDLPTAGWGRIVATLIGAVGVAVGLLLAFGRRTTGKSTGEQRKGRDAILEELAELERGRAAGEFGPRTYERAYRELIDALARTLVKTSSTAPVGKVPVSVGTSAGVD